MRRTPWGALSVVLILGLALMSCDGPSRGASTQPSSASGFLVSVTVSPNVLRPPDTAVITVKVSNTLGQLVDGATCTVTATLATQPNNVARGVTIRGFLTVSLFLEEGTRSGTSIVTAACEDAVATALITVVGSGVEEG
jgi:hypothetical protein